MNNSFATCFKFPFERFGSLVGLFATFGALVWLAPLLVSQIIQFIVALIVALILAVAQVDGDAISIIAQIIGGLVGGLAYIPTMPFYPAFFRCLDMETQGQSAPVSQLFAWRGLVGPSIVAGLLAGVILIAGYVLCVVPGLLLLPISVMPYYFVARGDSGTAAISKSFTVLMQQPMTILYVWGFISIMFIGILACCIGVIVTLPMYLAAVYLMMRGINVEQQRYA